MTIRRRQSHTRLFTKDGGFYSVAVEEHSVVLAAWMKGQAFWEGLGLYGEPLAIKLSEVQGIGLTSAESIALARADDEAEEAEKKARDLLNGGE